MAPPQGYGWRQALMRSRKSRTARPEYVLAADYDEAIEALRELLSDRTTERRFSALRTATRRRVDSRWPAIIAKSETTS